jgi:sugar lactone lactonase YvrE
MPLRESTELVATDLSLAQTALSAVSLTASRLRTVITRCVFPSNQRSLTVTPRQVGNLRNSRLGSLRYVIARSFVGRRGFADSYLTHLLMSAATKPCEKLRVGLIFTISATLGLFVLSVSAGAETTNDYSAVDALFAKHCLDCHAAQEPEAKLVLESFDALMKGGESGKVVVPGKSTESLLIQAVETGLDRDGKKKLMPPGKREKLKPEEVAVLKAWIDAGAVPPKEMAKLSARELVLPKIQPTVPPRRSIQAVAWSPALKLIAVARYGEVELVSVETRQVVRRLAGLRGGVNALAFSADGKSLATAAGEPALFGQATLWDAPEGKLVRTFEGHTDSLYAIAISPDGQTLATGSYDQKIKLWKIASGELLHTLSAHNGAIFDLAFRPDGKILASASGDRTVKLWNVATGKRVETLNQPLKEQSALAWSPDGKRLAAAGGDNRIRIWEVSDTAAETTNPLLFSTFAHDGAILNLLYSSDGKRLLSSADDRTIKVWDAAEATEKLSFETQPDVTPALAFVGDGKTLVAGRLDGSMEFYNSETGKRAPLPAPELIGIAPRGLQRGTSAAFKLSGKNLAGVTNALSSNPKLAAEVSSEAGSAEVAVKLTTANDLPRGGYELWVAGPGGESEKIKVFVDDLPQVFETRRSPSPQPSPGGEGEPAYKPPLSIWGTIDQPGHIDEFRFTGKAGETVVLDLTVRTVASKLQNGALSLLDERGLVLESNSGFDGADRLVAYRIPTDGTYIARVADQMLGASQDHFYRLSIGPLPYVTSAFPLGVTTNTESEVQLVGVNLPPETRVRVKSAGAGELDVPIDPERFRIRRPFKLVVADTPQVIEQEPNDAPAQATPMSAPGAANGVIGNPRDEDFFRFEVRAGEVWILETDAARHGSPVDTKIEVFKPDGKPVPRLRLQAVRNTAINFRGVDSNNSGLRLDNYEEMELNEFLYLNGEVMRLYRMPQGPDSEMMMYSSAGKRRAYFDTTAVAHALDEQGFIVRLQPLGTKLAATGLPVLTLNYENDDDDERKLGSDSKLFFTAPSNGTYVARVTDTRGHGGESFSYRLVVREPRPDFTVTLSGANPTISPGSGQSFTVTAERIDGFEGEIRVDITGLPSGFTVSTPIVIEAGHTEAKGTIFAAMDAPKPDGTNGTNIKVTATATVNGKAFTKPVNDPGTLKLGDRPKLYVSFEPYSEGATNRYDPAHTEPEPITLTIVPGQRIPAWLKIQRNGHEDLVTFFVENLPHGVIVDNIGLNGVLIPKGESERQIFLTAAKWVTEMDRWCYAIEQQAGKQTSRPVLLKVRRAAQKQTASTK